MKRYIKPNGKLHDFELDGSQDYLITSDMVACQKDANGNYYKAYKVDGTPDLVKIAELVQREAVAHFTALTDAHIANAINTYNEANGTAFSSVHNCESYSRMTGYTHQAFCAAVWTWSVQVWEAVRAYQASVTEVPTDAEFQDVLDSVVLAY